MARAGPARGAGAGGGWRPTSPTRATLLVDLYLSWPDRPADADELAGAAARALADVRRCGGAAG
jgi:hypothetical protein